MAGKLFIGFDLDRSTTALTTEAQTNASLAIVSWPKLSFPRGVFHNNGIATQDSNVMPPNGSVSGSSGGLFDTAATGSVGCSYGDYNGSSGYTTGANVTRPSYQTSKGFQLGIIRSQADLTGDEFYISFDLKVSSTSTSLPTATPTDLWNAVFRWGDVSVFIKSQTINGSTREVVFSLRNAGVEVATGTAPSLASNTWMFCLLRVKLHASAGAIQFIVNANQQSTPYVNQNTVSLTSAAAADVLYIGPGVLDSGTAIYVMSIDNIYFDNSTFPAGRPGVIRVVLNADDSATNMAAVGTSPTTIVNALSNMTDAKQLRASVANGSAVLTTTPPTTTGYATDIIGLEVLAQGAANRNTSADRRVQIGYSLSGVETMGTKAKNTPLIFDSTATPPTVSANRTFPVEQIFTTSAAALMSRTQLATLKIVIKSSAP